MVSRAGKVLEVDFRSQKHVWVTQFIQVKVLIEASTPLCPGFFLARQNRDTTWVQLKFERISGLCFNYGRIGHMINTCCAPISQRVEPYCFSPRMFVGFTDYRKFSGNGL